MPTRRQWVHVYAIYGALACVEPVITSRPGIVTFAAVCGLIIVTALLHKALFGLALLGLIRRSTRKQGFELLGGTCRSLFTCCVALLITIGAIGAVLYVR